MGRNAKTRLKMDELTRGILSIKLLKACDCDINSAIYSFIPLLGKELEIYTHNLHNLPKILDSAMAVFTNQKLKFSKNTSYYMHIKKNQEKFISLSLQELFSTSIEKEWLRNYCEQFLKTDAIISSYFSGKTPVLTSLDYNLIHTFVLEPEALCIIFQPYTVAGMTDSLPIIKIPYEKLKVHWNPFNPLAKCVPFSQITVSWPQISEESGEFVSNQEF